MFPVTSIVSFCMERTRFFGGNALCPLPRSIFGNCVFLPHPSPSPVTSIVSCCMERLLVLLGISHLWNFWTRLIYHLGSRKIVRIEGGHFVLSPICFQPLFPASILLQAPKFLVKYFGVNLTFGNGH